MKFAEPNFNSPATENNNTRSVKPEDSVDASENISLVALKEKLAREEKAEKERQADYDRRFNEGNLSAQEQADLQPELAEIYQANLDYKLEFQQKLKAGNLSNAEVSHLTLDELA